MIACCSILDSTPIFRISLHAYPRIVPLAVILLFIIATSHVYINVRSRSQTLWPEIMSGGWRVKGVHSTHAAVTKIAFDSTTHVLRFNYFLHIKLCTFYLT